MFSGIRRNNGVQGLRVLVQSDKNPQYVESRIEAFLLKMEVKTVGIENIHMLLCLIVVHPLLNKCYNYMNINNLNIRFKDKNNEN